MTTVYIERERELADGGAVIAKRRIVLSDRMIMALMGAYVVRDGTASGVLCIRGYPSVMWNTRRWEGRDFGTH